MGRNLAAMSRVADLVDGAAVRYCKVAAVELDQRTTFPLGSAPGMPVDTGRARASSRITLGAPSTEVMPEQQAYVARGEAEAYAALELFALGMMIYLSWIALYTRYLDEGWSPQAPQGMTAYSIPDTIRALSNMRIDFSEIQR